MSFCHKYIYTDKWHQMQCVSQVRTTKEQNMALSIESTKCVEKNISYTERHKYELHAVSRSSEHTKHTTECPHKATTSTAAR